MRSPATARLALAAVLGTLALPATAGACSKVFAPRRSAATATFVGAATADTVLAGAGAVRYTLAEGHHGPGYGQARPIHGQVVAVRQLDARTRRLLPAGTTRVVLVPWDYGPDCRPTLWSNAFRWAAPGATGLFVAELRDRAHWAGGVPTLDVHEPTWFPYVGGVARSYRGAGDGPMLSADQLLGLYEVTPTHPERERDFAAAHAPLIAWARRHPDLARRWPAAEALRILRHQEEERRIAAIAPPMAGTYRLTFALDGAADRTVWLRTWERPSHGEIVHPRATPDIATDPATPERSDAYYVAIAGDTALAALPETVITGTRPHQGYLRVALDADGEADGPSWRGAIGLDVLAHLAPDDRALAAFVEAADEETSRRYRARLPWPTPAIFTRAADGTIRVEQRTTLADGRTLVVRGERVSAAVIRDVPPGPR